MSGQAKSPAPRDAEPFVDDQCPADRLKGRQHASASRRTATARVRRQRLAEQVHELGPAPMLHLLEEIARGADLDERLERYAGLPADFIRVLGGDRFAPNVTVVAGGGE
jgi:hypothetical protein